jgi:small nuclear ribonucleoprotein (snRNP)-like protein
LLYYFSINAKFINKTISLLFQIIGGLLILYSIDSNIGVINQKSLLSLLGKYFNEFPLIKRSVVIEVQSGGGIVIGGGTKIVIGRNPQTIDEKIDYLQEQINELKLDVEQESKELNGKIVRLSKEMNIQIQDAKSTIQSLESKMAEVSIGGIKVQLFGVLLMVYGAISSYVT